MTKGESRLITLTLTIIMFVYLTNEFYFALHCFFISLMEKLMKQWFSTWYLQALGMDSKDKADME